MIKKILHSFRQSSNPEFATGMKAYLKNQFDAYGILTPVRRSISKPILEKARSLSKTETVALARQLYEQEQRECHYIALELLEQKVRDCVRKKTTESLVKEDLEWMEWFVTHRSWWDTVDLIAPKIMGPYFLTFPGERKHATREWIASGNIWLIRSAILFQLKYKDQTDVRFLFDVILRTCHTQEFFINKAIGWILRENAKRVPQIIYAFVEKNKSNLHSLSIREALKHKAG